MKLGTPTFGDPGSPISYELGDLGPQVNMILGTPGALFSYEIGDPLMKLGTPMQWSIFPGKDFPNYNNNVTILYK